MPRRYQLEAGSLAECASKARELYGPTAQIVAAEKTIEGGLGGFFGTVRYTATVLVPDEKVPAARPRIDLRTRVGMAALLADADDEDVDLFVPERPALSTERTGFDQLVEDLIDQTGAARPTVPVLRTGAGDLIVVVGIRSDADDVARAMREHSGAIAPSMPVTDRGSALGARAESVAARRAVIATLSGDAAAVAASLAAVGADQVWAAVDASRKHEDTTAWLAALAGVRVTALAVLGQDVTATPGTVETLGVPVGWVGSGPVDAAHRDTDRKSTSPGG